MNEEELELEYELSDYDLFDDGDDLILPQYIQYVGPIEFEIEPHELDIPFRKNTTKEEAMKTLKFHLENYNQFQLRPYEEKEIPLEFKNHVGYEVWSKYEVNDQMLTFRDLSYAYSIKRYRENVLKSGMGSNILGMLANSDTQRFLDRYLEFAKCEEPFSVEPIPAYLTPDLARGVNYTNTLLEMKNKKVMERWRPPLKEEFKEEDFSYNNKVRPLHLSGTIREQYDWRPTITKEQGEIDPEIAKKIKPVLDFANFTVELWSTKVFINYLSLFHLFFMCDRAIFLFSIIMENLKILLVFEL